MQTYLTAMLASPSTHRPLYRHSRFAISFTIAHDERYDLCRNYIIYIVLFFTWQNYLQDCNGTVIGALRQLAQGTRASKPTSTPLRLGICRRWKRL